MYYPSNIAKAIFALEGFSLLIPFGSVHEFGVLRQTCEAATRKDGGMHVVLLKGNSGVGKTKPLPEVRRIACIIRAMFGSVASTHLPISRPDRGFTIC